MKAAFEKQVGGRHYVTMKMQHTYFATLNEYDPAAYSLLKYVSRDGRKHEGPVDLEKALHFIDLREALINMEALVKTARHHIPMQEYITANGFTDPHLSGALHALHFYAIGQSTAEHAICAIIALRDARYGEAHGKEAKH